MQRSLNFPPELCTNVVASGSLSKCDLKATALISRNWRHASQKELFRVLHVSDSSSKQDAWADLWDESPRVFQYIDVIAFHRVAVRRMFVLEPMIAKFAGREHPPEIILHGILGLTTNGAALTNLLGGFPRIAFYTSEVTPPTLVPFILRLDAVTQLSIIDCGSGPRVKKPLNNMSTSFTPSTSESRLRVLTLTLSSQSPALQQSIDARLWHGMLGHLTTIRLELECTAIGTCRVLLVECQSTLEHARLGFIGQQTGTISNDTKSRTHTSLGVDLSVLPRLKTLTLSLMGCQNAIETIGTVPRCDSLWIRVDCDGEELTERQWKSLAELASTHGVRRKILTLSKLGAEQTDKDVVPCIWEDVYITIKKEKRIFGTC